MANSRVIRFGLRNCYYAPIVDKISIYYAKPVPLIGAMSISLTPEYSALPANSGNVPVILSANNSGFNGSLSMADVPECFKKDVLGMTCCNGGLTSKCNDNIRPFALMFETNGNVCHTRYILYNCNVRPLSIDFSSNTNAVQYMKNTLALTVYPIRGGVSNLRYCIYTAIDDTPATHTDYVNWLSLLPIEPQMKKELKK